MYYTSSNIFSEYQKRYLMCKSETNVIVLLSIRFPAEINVINQIAGDLYSECEMGYEIILPPYLQ